MFQNWYLIFIFSFFLSQYAHLQSNLDWGVEVKEKSGFLIGKRPQVSGLPQSHTFATEFSFVVHPSGKKKWHTTYDFPSIGATLFGASVGNKEILGNFYGSYAFIEFPLLKTKKYQLLTKLGNGLVYSSKIYDPILNPKNSVISTHLNTVVCLGIKNQFVLGRNYFSIGLDLTHCSNGAFKVPNIGINMPFVSLGYEHQFTNPSNKNTSKDSLREVSIPFRKLLLGVSGVFSAKEIFPTGQGRLPVYGSSIFLRYFQNSKVGWEVSLDVISKQILTKYKPEIPKNQLDLIQVGLYAGYLLPLDHLHFVIGMGVNIRDKFVPEGMFYHRIGTRYYFNNGIHLNVVLRSNWAKADFAEWGIGYTFNYKKK